MDDGTLRSLNLVFRFILELVVLLALFLWGMSMSDSLPIQLLLAIGAPLLVMVTWALFVAPRAARRLADPARLVLELVIWALAALALALAVDPVVALMFAAAVLISLALMFVWEQRAY